MRTGAAAAVLRSVSGDAPLAAGAGVSGGVAVAHGDGQCGGAA